MSRRFRVAFSFAGEKREFVAKVAQILASQFGESAILYDKFHRAEFARADLGLYLPRLYHDDADLVVAVFCRDYARKEWCGLEWLALYGRIKQHQSAQVMLCRFDQVDDESLFGLAGFVDLDSITPQEAADLVLQRLAVNERLPPNHDPRAIASRAAGWPEIAPPLDWPIADHREAQAAFAHLITRDSPFRILPIRGQSDTGKSHLTKQFLGNALRIAGLHCGRFDFKGSADIDEELLRFAENLGVDVPTSGKSVSSQLGSILTCVNKRQTPTLLIFDTFESAGDAERGMKEGLLLSAVRSSWLRVIVVGQRTTVPHGEPWAGLSAPTIELRSPSPQEWFDYGQGHHKAGITLEFVQQLHECCGGRSSLLAQILGPTT